MRRILVTVAVALLWMPVWGQSDHGRQEFEVASVRAVVPGDAGSGQVAQKLRAFVRSGRRPGEIPMVGADRVRLKGWALLDLIAAAYEVRAAQVSGPEWMADQIFDVEATVPEGTKKAELNGMLAALLEERFGVKVHRETQTRQGYVMTTGKGGPKLNAADPPQAPTEELTEEEKKTRMEQDSKANLQALMKRMAENPGGSVSTASWKSITMEQLAAHVVGAPVVDRTGLGGTYSVTIDTSKNADGSGVSVFDAVEKLGLKLEPGKVTVEKVVVDAAAKTATAN